MIYTGGADAAYTLPHRLNVFEPPNRSLYRKDYQTATLRAFPELSKIYVPIKFFFLFWSWVGLKSIPGSRPDVSTAKYHYSLSFIFNSEKGEYVPYLVIELFRSLGRKRGTLFFSGLRAVDVGLGYRSSTHRSLNRLFDCISSSSLDVGRKHVAH